MRNNPIRDCYNLFYIEALKIKNTMIDSFSHPLEAIKTIFRYIFPIILIGWSYYQRISHKGEVKQDFNLSIGMNIAGAVVILFILLIILSGIYSASGKYNPSQFTISDVEYLFPSPISPRSIYVFTMIRSSFLSIIKTVFTLVIYWFLGSAFYSLQGSKAVYVIAAFFLISIFSKSVSFFVYSISNKFDIGKYIKAFVKLFSAFLVLYIVWLLRNSKSILNDLTGILNGKFFSNIPIAGWAKDMIISPLSKTSCPNLQTIALVLVTIIILVLAVYFAKDYYEEAAESTEFREKIMNAARNKDNGEVQKLQESRAHKKQKKNQRINININGQFNGALAFAWKQAIKAKRTKGSVFFNKSKLFILATALLCGFIFRDHTGNNIIIPYISGFFGILIVLPMSLSPLKDEMRKQYLFLLPGKARDKILAVHSVTAINSLINCALVTFPILVFARKVSFIEMLSLFLALISTTYLIFLSVLIMTLIMPAYDDGKNAVFIYVIDAVLLAPSILTAVITGIFISHAVAAVLTAFAIVTLITMLLLIFFSEKLFSKVELR